MTNPGVKYDAAMEVARLRALLERLEWSWHGGGCPACTATPEQGHRVTCELATELRRATGRGP